MASNKILEPNTGHNPRTFGGSVHRLLATTAALATAGARRGWWKKARREVRAASEPAASVRGSFDFESESVQDAHDRVVAEDNIIGDTTEAVAHLRHSHRSDTGSGAPNGLATTACTGCRVNGARKADIEKPMTQVPSGREGFHLLGVPDSWSPTVPLAEETDYSPFELRTWRDAELQAIYDRVPRHESLESSEAFYDYYLPRMDDSVRLYRTSQYRSGICQRYEWSAGSRSLNAVQALCAATHPELRPNATPTGFPEKLHVPGQLQLTPGVPLVVWSPEKEHLKFTQTVAVVHTPSTLDASPGTTMPTADIFKSIARNAMGNLDAADPRDRVPFYKLDGLRKNMRDKGAHASEFEGSYSLAWTSGEGQGAGNVQPAAQTDDPYVRERQRILVYDIGA
ncbi:hypothetical protein EXIGLDRAFT_138453 [Exidia glandulosa HHB12029]|uniref:Uncharacterized protein n=1 Tax=Exidia glandulosa HHB12029 TaxID=1314781 RepID=A0A165FZK9_EXIGL|nr:hypothetical protein EXIGLDRAFT_138453 [Exidia glandulosa HHB12029]